MVFRIKKRDIVNNQYEFNRSLIEQLTVLIDVVQNHEERIKKLERRRLWDGL